MYVLHLLQSLALFVPARDARSHAKSIKGLEKRKKTKERKKIHYSIHKDIFRCNELSSILQTPT